jgi:hypothetical protein
MTGAVENLRGWLRAESAPVGGQGSDVARGHSPSPPNVALHKSRESELGEGFFLLAWGAGDVASAPHKNGLDLLRPSA